MFYTHKNFLHFAIFYISRTNHGPTWDRQYNIQKKFMATKFFILITFFYNLEFSIFQRLIHETKIQKIFLSWAVIFIVTKFSLLIPFFHELT